MLKAIGTRRSVRKYLDKKVEQEKILELINSARLAPSGHNTQPWSFILVESQDMKRRLAAADHEQSWMTAAPVFIVCLADIRCRLAHGEDIRVDESSPEPELKLVIRDTAIAIGYLLLEAENQGLSACWTGWYKQEDVRAILNIPDHQYVCGIVTVGYGAQSPEPRPRKSLEELIRTETGDSYAEFSKDNGINRV